MTRTRAFTWTRLFIAGAFVVATLPAPAADGDATELRRQVAEELGVYTGDVLPQSSDTLSDAISAEADSAAAQAQDKAQRAAYAEARDWIASDAFAALAPASRDRSLLTLAKETPLPEPNASVQQRIAFRGLMEVIRDTPHAAEVAVPGCREAMTIPLFRYERVALARITDLNDLEAWENAERSASTPAEWLRAAVTAEGVSLQFRRQATAQAFDMADGDPDFVHNAWRRILDKHAINADAATVLAEAMAADGAAPHLLWMVERGERPVRQAALQTLKPILAGEGAVAIDVPAAGARLLELAQANPEAAAGIYDAFPMREAPEWAVEGLFEVLGTPVLGAEAAKVLGDTQSDELAARLGQLGRETLNNPAEGSFERAKNIALALRLMETEAADAQLRALAEAPVADGPDAKRLAKLQRKAVAGL
jgi:hypothetical protein